MNKGKAEYINPKRKKYNIKGDREIKLQVNEYAYAYQYKDINDTYLSFLLLRHDLWP